MLPNRTGALALCVLVIQNTSLVIMLKLSFRPGAQAYSTSTVVLTAETAKFIICAVVCSRYSRWHVFEATTSLSRRIVIFLPSLLYVIQNNLLIYGSRHLTPLVFATCSQTKIFTTALASRCILGTRQSYIQHTALIFLVLGVVILQDSVETQVRNSSPTYQAFATESLGILSVLFASVLSGVAGVTLEKVYKSKTLVEGCEENEVPSVWSRNLQLSMISIPFAAIGVYVGDRNQIMEKGFFSGYDSIVYLVVALSACGGIIIAFIMKYANNILKCLAIAISVCFCGMFSVFSGEISASFTTIAGMVVAVSSVCVYILCPITLDGEKPHTELKELQGKSSMTSRP